MKRFFVLILLIITMFTLSSCFLFGDFTVHPDMVEYSKEQILDVAKNKYNVEEWIFDNVELVGKVQNDGTNFKVELCSDKFSSQFVDGDNIENALQAFAGKNGNHDVQGKYSIFLCFVALGKCADGSLKYVYYNMNIHKDAVIADTIGASAYTFDVSPTEITDDLFNVDQKWTEMQLFMKDCKGNNPKGFVYSGERLTRYVSTNKYGISLEFYKEDGKVVCDMYYANGDATPNGSVLFYSTSSRYRVIYNYYGSDATQYFDISHTVEQSSESANMMLLNGNIQLKPLDGKVVFSQIKYRAEYDVMYDGKIMQRTDNEIATNQATINKGWLIDKIGGVNHAETSQFSVYDYYILYEKDTLSK